MSESYSQLLSIHANSAIEEINELEKKIQVINKGKMKAIELHNYFSIIQL